MAKNKVVKTTAKAVRRIVAAVAKAPMQRKTRPRKGKRAITVSRAKAPAAVASILRMSTRNSVYRTGGCDYAANLNITASSVADGDVLFSKGISPQLFGNSRISELAKAFTKYRFTEFHATLGGNLPSSIGGGFIAGLSNDPAIEIANGVAGKSEVMGWPGAVRSAYWKPESCSLPTNSRDKWFYTSQSPNTEVGQSLNVQQALLVVLADGVPFGATGSFPLPITVEYKIEFDEPVSRPQQQTGSVFSFDIQYNQVGAPFKILTLGTSSGFDFVSGYLASTNTFIKDIYALMEPYTTCVYQCNQPVPPSAYNNAPAGAIIQYCWKDPRVNFVYFTDNLNTAMTDASTYNGNANFVSWPTPNIGALTTYTFTAIPNTKISTPASRRIVRPTNDVEVPITEGTMAVVVEGQLNSTDILGGPWVAALEAALMDLSKGAYSIVANPIPGDFFVDGSARNVVWKDPASGLLYFSNDIADVFSGSPTPAAGINFATTWPSSSTSLRFNFIEMPLTGIIGAPAPNEGRGAVADALCSRVDQIAASHNTLTEAINNLASKIALLEAQV